MKQRLNFVAGILVGITLMACTGFTRGNQTAVPTWQPIYVDGEQVQMTAYNINGNNYVKLRDIGEKVGINVYWQDGVQVDTTSPYTGEPPVGQVSKQPGSGAADIGSDRDLDAVRMDMIQKINAIRQDNGAEPLIVNDALMAAAQECAEQHFSHHDNRFECESVIRNGYEHGFGSNLTLLGYSKGTDIATRAVNSWKFSPGHFNTMIKQDCDTIGVGVSVTSDWIYCYMFAGCPTAHNPYE